MSMASEVRHYTFHISFRLSHVIFLHPIRCHVQFRITVYIFQLYPCRCRWLQLIFRFFSEIFEIQIFIGIFGYCMVSAFKWVPNKPNIGPMVLGITLKFGRKKFQNFSFSILTLYWTCKVKLKEFAVTNHITCQWCFATSAIYPRPLLF